MAERKMKSIHVELLMGHSIGLGDNYYRISGKELRGIPQGSFRTKHHLPFNADETRVQNLEDEVLRLKIGFADLVQSLSKNNNFDPNLLLDMVPELKNKIRLSKNKEMVYIKDHDGSEIMF